MLIKYTKIKIEKNKNTWRENNEQVCEQSNGYVENIWAQLSRFNVRNK